MKRIKYITTENLNRIKASLVRSCIRDMNDDITPALVSSDEPDYIAEDLEAYVGRLKEIGAIKDITGLYTHVRDWEFCDGTEEFHTKYKDVIVSLDVPDGYIVENLLATAKGN